MADQILFDGNGVCTLNGLGKDEKGETIVTVSVRRIFNYAEASNATMGQIEVNTRDNTNHDTFDYEIEGAQLTLKHGDKKYVYWAAGEQVFRFRFDPAIPLRPLSVYREVAGMHLKAAEEIPPPSDPKELEGCYLNPFRAGNVPYMREFEKVPGLLLENWMDDRQQ